VGDVSELIAYIECDSTCRIDELESILTCCTCVNTRAFQAVEDIACLASVIVLISEVS
jgi:hypothetical protein